MKRILFFLCLLVSTQIFAERIKDVTSIAGVRHNQLIGYGLVVGLDGTGDSSTGFTNQTFRTMLHQLGVTVPETVNISLKNVAAVAVSADLPPFMKPGQTLDVTVSSIGDAKSLRGGTLVLTPLKGSNAKVYAVAQGNLVVGGFGASGSDGSKITVNVPSVGRIPNGATIEREVPSPFSYLNKLVLNLNKPDFTTANRIAHAINQALGKNMAKALDGASVEVKSPEEHDKRVSFISAVENLLVKPGDGPARIVVNSRTGTIVIGQHVKVLPAAVSHGSLTLTISENTRVSQPPPLAEVGSTVTVPDAEIKINQDSSRMFIFGPGTSLSEIVTAVNQVGAAPGDLMAILEALKEVGALKAELVVI